MAKEDIFEMEKKLNQCGFETDVDLENDMILCSHKFFNDENMNVDDGLKLIDIIIEKPKYSNNGLDDDGFYVVGHNVFLNGWF